MKYTSKNFETLQIYKYIINSDLKKIVDKIIEDANDILNQINGEFKEYTFHDIGHAYRVAKYMEDIILGIDKKTRETRKGDFSELEFAIIIIVACLHDIGMFFTEEEYLDIISKNELYLNKFSFKGVLFALRQNDPNISERLVVHELVRKIHHVRSAEYINRNYGNLLKIDGIYSLAGIIAKICQAHGEDYSYLYNLKTHDECGSFSYDARYIAAILRIADLLDIDGQRTPIVWYNLNKPKGISDKEWQTHFSISNYNKFKNVDGKLLIYFVGRSAKPEIHRNYLKYIENLRKELVLATDLLSYNSKFLLLTRIEDNVETEDFRYVDLRLNLDYKSITDLLMGTNIYREKKLGLRELIQNAIDACKLRQEKVEDDPIHPYRPKIAIEISKKDNYVKIYDNGIGMDLNVIKNYFLNVGISYYNSDEFYYHEYKYNPIGKFGIGFLACYLLSNNVVVRTKHFQDGQSIQIELESGSEYVVTRRSCNKTDIGTEIELVYTDFFNVFKDIDDLKKFIGAYFFTDINIILYNRDNKDEEKVKYIKRSDFYKNYSPRFTCDSLTQNILCEKYDDQIKGNIIIRLDNYSINEVQFNNESYVYIYKSGRFIKQEPSFIKDGEYYTFKYPILKKADTKSKKKLKSVIGDRLYSFLIPKNMPINISGIIQSDQIEENIFGDVLNKSKIYAIDYDELHIESIFKNGNKALLLYESKIGRFSNENEFDEEIQFYSQSAFYYRDILVGNKSFEISTPFDFQILGWCVNHIDSDNNMKLNVSRQGFNNIRPYIIRLASIILKYFKEAMDTYQDKSHSEILYKYFEIKLNAYRSQL